MSGELWGKHPETDDETTHLWTRAGSIDDEPAFEPRCGDGERLPKTALSHLMVSQTESLSESFCSACRSAVDQ